MTPTRLAALFPPFAPPHHGTFQDDKYNGPSARVQFRNVSVQEREPTAPARVCSPARAP